jgi:hypothetical protein
VCGGGGLLDSNGSDHSIMLFCESGYEILASVKAGNILISRASIGF